MRGNRSAYLESKEKESFTLANSTKGMKFEASKNKQKKTFLDVVKLMKQGLKLNMIVKDTPV